MPSISRVTNQYAKSKQKGGGIFGPDEPSDTETPAAPPTGATGTAATVAPKEDDKGFFASLKNTVLADLFNWQRFLAGQLALVIGIIYFKNFF